jgi:hypothetical protein
MDLSHLEK